MARKNDEEEPVMFVLPAEAKRSRRTVNHRQRESLYYQETGFCGQCLYPGRLCVCPGQRRCGCWFEHNGNRNREASVDSWPLFGQPEPNE